MALAVTTSQALDVVLAIFLVVVGLAIGYAFWRLGVLFSQLRTTVKHTEEEVLPVISKTGGTLDRVNTELDKVDVMTDSAVDAVTASTGPSGPCHAVVTAPSRRSPASPRRSATASPRSSTHRDVDEAIRTAKDAGTRRMADLADELDQAGRRHSGGR